MRYCCLFLSLSIFSCFFHILYFTRRCFFWVRATFCPHNFYYILAHDLFNVESSIGFGCSSSYTAWLCVSNIRCEQCYGWSTRRHETMHLQCTLCVRFQSFSCFYSLSLSLPLLQLNGTLLHTMYNLLCCAKSFSDKQIKITKYN